MTQDRDSAKLFTRRRVLVRLLLGLALLAAVFFLAVRSDMAAAQRMLETTADYIKEQCNRYARIELASETKSLMRIVESGKQVAHDLVENGGLQTEKALEGYAKSSYVSGVLLLDRQGNILSQYHAEETPALVLEALDSPALLDIINYPQKRYAVRLTCADGGEIDLAATGRQDTEGIVVSYYQTPVEYIHSFNLSVSSLLSGYSMEKNGIIVVSSGETIVASNEESLVGKNTNTLPILQKIKASGTGNKMIHASQEGESISQFWPDEAGTRFLCLQLPAGAECFCQYPAAAAVYRHSLYRGGRGNQYRPLENSPALPRKGNRSPAGVCPSAAGNQ